MTSKRGAVAQCTAERLEEVFSSTRIERSLAPVRECGSDTESVSSAACQPIPFPSRPPDVPFLSRLKDGPKPNPSQAATREDPLRHFSLRSGGQDVETSVLSFLAVCVFCAWLLFWLIGQFAHFVK